MMKNKKWQRGQKRNYLQKRKKKEMLAKEKNKENMWWKEEESVNPWEEREKRMTMGAFVDRNLTALFEASSTMKPTRIFTNQGENSTTWPEREKPIRLRAVMCESINL
jgi:hypothetical protein